MKEFDELLAVADQLLGPGGCPWDHTQTFLTLQTYVLEEAHEVVDAVDRGIDVEIIEELGDLLYTVVFYGQLAKKTNRFTMSEVINAVKEKLIRRHPHVFSDVQVEHIDDIVNNWEKIKKQEKGDQKRPLSGVPVTLPALMRAQKIIRKMIRAHIPIEQVALPASEAVDEEGIGARILREIVRAEEAGIDAESAVRRALQHYEEHLK